MNRLLRKISTALFSLSLIGAACAQDTIKIAVIDPLTGAAGLAGELSYKHLQLAAKDVNAAGGALGRKLEIVHFENRANPQESQIQAQKAVDAGIQFIATGISSAAGVAIADFVRRNNERNPDKRVLLLNYASVDPALSNEKCSWWQTVWDANTNMKTRALVLFTKSQPQFKKIYLINQDYGAGQSAQAEARASLKSTRPDIEIVGDELVPLMKVNDFTPYITKIRESGADLVFTSNWGPDLSLLLKAAGESGLKASWLTIFAAGPGGPLSIKQANLAPRAVYAIADGHAGVNDPSYRDLERHYRAEFGKGLTIVFPRAFNAVNQLTQAIKEANSTDPRLVAEKLNGRKFKSVVGGEAWLRAENNAVMQPLHISSFGPLAQGQEFDESETGWGWRDEAVIAASETEMPTTCKLTRPN